MTDRDHDPHIFPDLPEVPLDGDYKAAYEFSRAVAGEAIAALNLRRRWVSIMIWTTFGIAFASAVIGLAAILGFFWVNRTVGPLTANVDKLSNQVDTLSEGRADVSVQARQRDAQIRFLLCSTLRRPGRRRRPRWGRGCRGCVGTLAQSYKTMDVPAP